MRDKILSLNGMFKFFVSASGLEIFTFSRPVFATLFILEPKETVSYFRDSSVVYAPIWTCYGLLERKSPAQLKNRLKRPNRTLGMGAMTRQSCIAPKNVIFVQFLHSN